MKISKAARRDAKQLFRSTFSNGIMDPAKVRQAVSALIAQKPRGYVAILGHLQRLVKLEEARRAAKVESAAPLAEEQKKDVNDRLSKLYGPGLNVTYAQNPALIGGLRIKVGSDVYDGSVQARLAALEENL